MSSAGTKRKKEAPLKSRPRDRRLSGGSNGINYSGGAKRSKASDTAKTSGDAEYVGSSSSDESSSSDSESWPPSKTPYGPVYKTLKARQWYQEERRKRQRKKEEDDGGSDSSSEELLTPRASPKNNTAAAATAGINRPTALVTFPSSEASVSRVVGISAAVQSAIESKLGRRDGDDRDKLLLNMNILIGNKTAIVEAAAKCSASLRKRTFEAIPTKKFALKTRKPFVAAAMSKAWSTLYEVLRNKNHGLTTRVLKDLTVFIEILERAHKYCLVESERAKISSNKGMKTVKLTKAALDREYGKGGGKPYDEPCARCNHAFTEKEPDFDEKRKENRKIQKKFIENRKHLEEYENNERDDPPLDEAGKTVTKFANPKLLPTHVQCQCLKNYNSLVRGGKKCFFGCKYGGVQYPLGECPICQCDCNFVCDTNKYMDTKRHYEMERLKNETTADERAHANEYLDRAGRFGREMESDVADHLHSLREDGGLEGYSATEIDHVAREAGCDGQAKMIVHNPPGGQAQTFLEKVMTQADHQKGASFSIPHNAHMRVQNQAAKQRASNTRLDGATSLHSMGGIGGVQDHSSDGFSSAHVQEAIRNSMQSEYNVAASNHSYESRSGCFFSSDMNAAIMRSTQQDCSNLSRDSFSLGTSFRQNSNISSNQRTGPYKTAESVEDDSPAHVKSCRTLMFDASMDSDADEEDQQAAVGAANALSKPYDTTMVNFAQRIVDKKLDDAKATKKLKGFYNQMKQS